MLVVEPTPNASSAQSFLVNPNSDIVWMENRENAYVVWLLAARDCPTRTIQPKLKRLAIDFRIWFRIITFAYNSVDEYEIFSELEEISKTWRSSLIQTVTRHRGWSRDAPPRDCSAVRRIGLL